MHTDNTIKNEIESTRRVLTRLETEYRQSLVEAGIVGAEQEYSPVADHLRGYVAALEGRGKLTGKAWGSSATGQAQVRSAQFNGGWHAGRRWLMRQQLDAAIGDPEMPELLRGMAHLGKTLLAAARL